MSSPSDIPQTVSIFCPTCGTLLHPDVKEQKHKVRCPDCFVDVPVPPLSEVIGSSSGRSDRAKLEDVGTYRIQSNETGEADQPAHNRSCTLCRGELPHLQIRGYIRKSASGRIKMRCPDCHEPVDVPALKDVPEKPRRKRPPEKIGTYETDEAIVPLKPETSYLEVQAADSP